MSYVFYAYWDWRFVGLMWVSTGIDYLAGRMIVAHLGPEPRAGVPDRRADGEPRDPRLLQVRRLLPRLAGGHRLGALGLDTDLPVVNVVLPIGISFYTFNSMSYTIDVYRGVCRPARNVVHYAAFVAMFPHLIAGPIVRYADIEAQLARLQPRLTAGLAASGIFFFACGLGKKLLFADAIAPTSTSCSRAHESLGFVSAWGAALGYSLQLYFDFSGYSDMAVGLAFLLGFRFPQNFNSPYKSVNISEFWRRWHMSLSFLLRDYLFIPLGGSRGSRAQTLRNLLIVMFLGGLWHGAAGRSSSGALLHGLFLVVHALARGAGLTPPSVVVNRLDHLRRRGRRRSSCSGPRALGDAIDVLSGMVGLHGVGVVSRSGMGYALHGRGAAGVRQRRAEHVGGDGAADAARRRRAGAGGRVRRAPDRRAEPVPVLPVLARVVGSAAVSVEGGTMSATDSTMWTGLLHGGLAGTFLRVPFVPPEADAIRESGAKAAIYGLPFDAHQHLAHRRERRPAADARRLVHDDHLPRDVRLRPGRGVAPRRLRRLLGRARPGRQDLRARAGRHLADRRRRRDAGRARRRALRHDPGRERDPRTRRGSGPGPDRHPPRHGAGRGRRDAHPLLRPSPAPSTPASIRARWR